MGDTPELIKILLLNRAGKAVSVDPWDAMARDRSNGEIIIDIALSIDLTSNLKPPFLIMVNKIQKQPYIACFLSVQPSNRSNLIKALDAESQHACFGLLFKVQWTMEVHEIVCWRSKILSVRRSSIIC